MNLIFKSLIAAVLLISTAAYSIPVSYTESAPQTQNGQLFNFEYNPIADSTGEGSLYILARGDYSPAFPTYENIGFEIDGVYTGLAAPAYGNVIADYSYNDVLFEMEFVISEVLMDSITDNLAAILVLDLSSDVDIFDSNSFVSATLSYSGVEIPEPAIIFVLGMGLLGFAAVKRNKS